MLLKVEDNGICIFKKKYEIYKMRYDISMNKRIMKLKTNSEIENTNHFTTGPRNEVFIELRYVKVCYLK